MTHPIIEARRIGKRYQLGTAGGSTYGSLRESLVSLALAPARMLGLAKKNVTEPFWALEDVSFDVRPGEVVGIIGRNGAGKSTLLKILSRITAPTTGEVRLRGRVASLLEVGTGFHPELTGRENIFLNGAILGMSRAEVRKQFDAIVAFAEMEKFLDTPVKRYSSGMRVRLAFAVAAHLQPEILIIDEVLAVGDASFQKKCLGKMEGVATSGRTVLFVSHNMAAVTRLCRRGILLARGRVAKDAPVHDVVATYLSGVAGEQPGEVDFEKRGKCPGSADVRMLAARVRSEQMTGGSADIRRSIDVEVDFEVLSDRLVVSPNIHVYNDESVCLFISNDITAVRRRPGRYRATARIPGNLMAEGMFTVDVALSTLDPVTVHAWERGLLTFQVHDPFEGDSARGNYGGPLPGVMRPKLQWRTDEIGAARTLEEVGT